MKILVISIIIILNVVLQSTIFQFFKIYNVVPNTALILVIAFAIHMGKQKGAVVGFFIGILQDILFSQIIGVNALVLMIVGYFVGSMNQKIMRDHLAVPFVLTVGATVFYEFISVLFLYLLRYQVTILDLFSRVLIIEVAYNAIVSIFVYIYVSKIFKTKSIRRRY
ncbi:hypothetical protein Amet_2292 [Alkaliphilus metalliredigens QYMF]|uniref:Uncharacterized protein n=1 Tax=Alkaliphilus metalliredigens (strain QYMF) TaxID=293826 RepID=A6TQI1_ALKMQ|nr:rod shape-determining protein MreD [Alkaliphilus metalliredigens]ABR48449.1 hypothetical protein Amet_2292 [Alkaliphilus metalliredigens QYMF]